MPFTGDELLEVGATEELLRHQVVAGYDWLMDSNSGMVATATC